MSHPVGFYALGAPTTSGASPDRNGSADISANFAPCFRYFQATRPFYEYSIYTRKDPLGSTTWGSGDTNLAKVKIEIILVLVVGMNHAALIIEQRESSILV
jgi:hypothetical protein